MAVSPRSLIERLNQTCRAALVEDSIRLCMARTHFHIELEHWLTPLLSSPNNALGFLLRQYAIDANKVKKELEAALNRFKTGNTRPPGFSTDILDAIREAWVFGSLELGAPQVRSAHLLYAMLSDRNLSGRVKDSSQELGRISVEKLASDISALLPNMQSEENAQEASAAAVASAADAASGVAPPRVGGKTPALDQFTVNLTAKAKQGMDPVIGRDVEIRQVIDILTRRRQNNPILTGEAGVGKTAVVEGLALRIAASDVPDPLKNVQLHRLDLGLLQAGAGVKGEFENRLKSVIDEVKRSPIPIILFIDEAHTLIGAGGAAGQNDAANLLKPALARGELRTIAATTFAEYKKYFETDAALKRRFQQVKVDEPDEQKAIRMLRGLVPMLEKHHKVRILDEAVVDAVRLSTRYMPDRQLPDKAVSLLDTTCARVALSQSATPPALDDTIRELEHLKTEIEFLEREGRVSAGNPERVADLKSRKAVADARREALEEQLKKEKELVAKIREKRDAIEKAGTEASEAEKLALAELTSMLVKVQGENP